VTSSPMKGAPAQTSSRDPSRPRRPHAVPVPSERAYHSEARSNHSTRPTVSRPGHGSLAPPDARSTIITLPLNKPWSLE
jgi:hypothetical protein